MNYCHLCGGKYIEGKSQPWICSKCRNEKYKNSNPGVEIALFNSNGEVLLSKRAINPNKGKYDLPGGFLNIDETLEEGLAREINEELGLLVEDYSKPEYVMSWVGKYSFSREILHNVMPVFVARLKNQDIKAQDDVQSVKFVSIDDLEKINFSYPNYPEIIRKAYKKLFG